MGYGGLKVGKDNARANYRSLQGRTKLEPVRGTARRKKVAWEEDYMRTLQDVRNMLAQGRPGATAISDGHSQILGEEWQEREGRLRQREIMQRFSNWICEERTSKMLGCARANCEKFGTLGESSWRASNGSSMCKMIYEREKERCKATNGVQNDQTPLPRGMQEIDLQCSEVTEQFEVTNKLDVAISVDPDNQSCPIRSLVAVKYSSGTRANGNEAQITGIPYTLQPQK